MAENSSWKIIPSPGVGNVEKRATLYWEYVYSKCWFTDLGNIQG